MEEEKREHESKMKKMEAEMEQVFEMKVKEKKQKLKDSELELTRRHEERKKVRLIKLGISFVTHSNFRLSSFKFASWTSVVEHLIRKKSTGSSKTTSPSTSCDEEASKPTAKSELYFAIYFSHQLLSSHFHHPFILNKLAFS